MSGTTPSWEGKKVLVTGGTGLLGSHLVRLCLERKADVIALVRDTVPKSLFYSSEPEWNLEKRVITVRGEVENYPLLERTVNEYEVDTIFHLAAQTIVGTANRSPLSTFRTNIEGTWNVLEAARVHPKLVKRVVIASSDKAYGNLKGNAYDESFPLNGEHPYDVSKSCADLVSKSFAVSYGVPVCITRCGNFFGPGDLNYSRIIPGTIRDVLLNRSPLIRSDGKFIRDYIFAEDGALAYLLLAEKMETQDLRGQAYNFSYGLRLSVLDVVQKVLQVMERGDLKPTILNEANNEIPVQCLDSTKARESLSWKPNYGFDEGLRKTIQWYSQTLGA